MYSKTTRSIRVTVKPQFLEDESKPTEAHFVWAYHIQIENTGEVSVQLLKRSWKIIDGLGETQIIQGEGVIGEKPIIDPGSSFEYTSGVPLRTPSGLMGGSYSMLSEFDEPFDVEIPLFSLDSPFELASLH